MRFARLLLVAGLLVAAPLEAGKFLFDATRSEMAGNADWVIDADKFNYVAGTCLNPPSNDSYAQRFPSPAQSGVNASTPETYWTGGISDWAIDLVKRGHQVETLPAADPDVPGSQDAPLTFNDGSNPQDLSNYDVLVLVEPNRLFSTAEKTAILGFVSAGGGLFMVADHDTSDRNCDGSDAVAVLDDLMGSTSATNAGVFGIWFRRDGISNNGSEDWFNEGVDNNTETNPADPIIFGPAGSGAGGLGLFGSTSMELNPANNSSVKGHVWRVGQAHNNSRVTFATAVYGAGRVAAIPDSSPADDGTGDPGDTLHLGWEQATGGVNNREIHLNACEWLLGDQPPDLTPPDILPLGAGATITATPADCTAVVAWTTDEPATSFVDFGPTTGYGSTASTAGLAISHSVTLTGLTAASTYHYQVRTADGTGNLTTSSDATFMTTAATFPQITPDPTVGAITGTSAIVSWTTNEASTSVVQYGQTASYGSSASTAGYVTSHSVTLSGLLPLTQYHYKVQSTDGCGNGPTESLDATFTTGSPSFDISGWELRQFNSTLVYTFPPGTSIPSGGYIVVARDATRAEFETFFSAAPRNYTLPPATVFLNSNADGSCANGCMPLINGAETFELWDGPTKIDGTTVAMTTNNTYKRNNPGDPAGTGSSWTIAAEDTANPGAGAGTGTGSGVRINEMADAADYTKEFVELYYDAGAGVTASPTVTPTNRCAATTTQLHASPSGGTGPYTYLWSPATGLSSTTIENPVSSVATTTAYTVVVTDSLSASSPAAPVTVNVSIPTTAPTATPPAVCGGASSQLDAVAAGGTPPYSYSWSPATGLSATNVGTPIATPAVTTIYSVVVTDALGCVTAAQPVTVTVGSACAPEVSDSGAGEPLRISKSGSGYEFRFEYPGAAYDLQMYSVDGESALDAGAYAAKWCDLSNATSGGTWATDSVNWATWTHPTASSFPDGNYVVVATDAGGVEGSYGQKSDSSERTHDADRSAASGWCPTATPTCSITSPTSGTVSGNVVVAYTATDADTPSLTATFSYSTNGGGSYLPATAAAGSSNPATIAPGSRSFTWNSAADVVGISSAVVFRVQVADATTSSTCTASFTVDNSPGGPCSTDLYFSEYIEGSSNNKALEIYNGTGTAVDLAAGQYKIEMYFNGLGTAGLTINLTGTVAAGDVHVVAHASAVQAILDQANQTNSSGWYNGDDAVVLKKNTTIIDVIGQIGLDPGTEWGTGLTSTADNTLVRKPAIIAGDANGADAFVPSTEWNGFATDTFTNLGAHTADCP